MSFYFYTRKKLFVLVGLVAKWYSS